VTENTNKAEFLFSWQYIYFSNFGTGLDVVYSCTLVDQLEKLLYNRTAKKKIATVTQLLYEKLLLVKKLLSDKFAHVANKIATAEKYLPYKIATVVLLSSDCFSASRRTT
jgi:hypothetical protein